MLRTPTFDVKNAKLQSVLIKGQELTFFGLNDLESVLDQFTSQFPNSIDQEPYCPFGGVLWPCSRAFLENLDKAPILLPTDIASLKSFKVLELGCGVGLVSCYLAKTWGVSVQATDLMPECEGFVHKNAHHFGVSTLVSFSPLDFRNPLPSGLVGDFDCVVGCDILYESHHLMHLPPLIKSLVKPGGSALIVDPKRYRYSQALAQFKTHFSSVQCIEIPRHATALDWNQGTQSKGETLQEIQLIHLK